MPFTAELARRQLQDRGVPKKVTPSR